MASTAGYYCLGLCQLYERLSNWTGKNKMQHLSVGIEYFRFG